MDNKMYSQKLVQRVNELRHDLISEQYGDSRPEIFEQEKDRWERIAKQYFDFAEPVTIIDIGTGTGFVPLTIAKFLKIGDIFICSDISRNILDVANRNIQKNSFSCRFKFVKIESQVPFQLPFAKESADILTLNSVLHHIENTQAFLRELDRILKPCGLLFIGHEPNRYFHENRFLRHNYFIMNHILNPKLIIKKVSMRMELENVVRKIYYFINSKHKELISESEKITDEINRVLLNERLLEKALSPAEVSAITDIKDREGFKPDLLLPHYKLFHFETYNHMLNVSIKYYSNFIIGKYDKLLKRKYPKEGATFFVVLKKES